MKQLLIFIFCIFYNYSALGEPDDIQNKNWLQKIEQYFSKLESFESQFEQTDGYGRRSTGKFYLKRKKGLMKLEYDSPSPHVLRVKRNILTHYDRDLEETTETSIFSHPLSFFLDRNLDLSNNLKIISIDENAEVIAIKLCKKDEEQEGAVMLVFFKDPFALRGWVLFEKKNDRFSNFTEILLFQPKINQELGDDVFEKVY